MIDKALLKLRPNAQWDLNGDEYEGIVWKDTEQTMPTKEEVTAKVAELEKEYTSKQYHRDRAAAYAPLSEQLDMQYHDSMNGTETWLDHIRSVKEAHPKEGE